MLSLLHYLYSDSSYNLCFRWILWVSHNRQLYLSIWKVHEGGGTEAAQRFNQKFAMKRDSSVGVTADSIGTGPESLQDNDDVFWCGFLFLYGDADFKVEFDCQVFIYPLAAGENVVSK
jgi:hypothetical protein